MDLTVFVTVFSRFVYLKNLVEHVKATILPENSSIKKGAMMETKKRGIISVVLAAGLFLSLQAQDWVKSFGHKQGDAVVAGLVTDKENNVLVTGTFSFEELVLGNGHVLQSRGMEDVFIVKYNMQGGILWAFSFGGEKQDLIADIALDNSGNIYVTGIFASTSLHVGGSVVTSSWPENVYIAKFDSSGVFQWLSKSEGLTGYSWTGGTAVHCVGDENVYFSGYTSGQNLNFGDINLSSETANTKGFYGKLDEEGNFLSADFLEGEGEERYQVNDIGADSDGNIYLAAKHTIHTNPDPITYSEYRDIMYFCKIGTDGKIAWVVEDTALYEGTNIIFQNDSLFVLGNREEYRAIFNGGTVDTTSSFFYGIIDSDGNRHLGRKVTGAMAYGLYVDSDRILVTGGLYLDHLELDGTWVHRNSDSSSICPIYQDIFFFESDLSGNIGRVSSIRGSLEDVPSGIWLSERGDLFYAGKYESASLQVEGEEIYNLSELSTFMHVSGTYYDRRQYSFLARREGFVQVTGLDPPVNEGFRIYPNPSSGMIHIERRDANGKAVIQVYDMTGRLLAGEFMEGKQTSLDLGELEEGYVILSLREGERVTNRPLLIVK